MASIGCFGVWRSWLARTAGGREVAGSSPVTPTNEKVIQRWMAFSLLVTLEPATDRHKQPVAVYVFIAWPFLEGLPEEVHD